MDIENIEARFEYFLKRAESKGYLRPRSIKIEELLWNPHFNQCAHAVVQGAPQAAIIADLCCIIAEQNKFIQDMAMKSMETARPKGGFRGINS